MYMNEKWNHGSSEATATDDVNPIGSFHNMTVHMEEDAKSTPITNQHQSVEDCSVVAKSEKLHRVQCLLANTHVCIQNF